MFQTPNVKNNLNIIIAVWPPDVWTNRCDTPHKAADIKTPNWTLTDDSIETQNRTLNSNSLL